MKYNIYLVLNSAYMEFGRVFLKSLYDVHNMNDISNVIIADTGLKEKHKQEIKDNFDKIRLVETGENTDFGEGIHSEQWYKTVNTKTLQLRKLLRDMDITPVVMIDADSLFLKSITPVINTDFDLQLCYRLHHDIPFIGSFVSINNREKGLKFLDKWIDIIANSTETTGRESPALVDTFEYFKGKIKIDLVPVKIVSLSRPPDFSDKTRVVHFKSSTPDKTLEKTIKKRLKSRFKDLVSKYV